MTDRKKEIVKKSIIYALFGVYLFSIHLKMGIVNDDLIESQMIYKETIWENFLRRFRYNGRICTDVLANLCYRIPFMAWKAIDTVVYIVMAWLMAKVFTKNGWKSALLVCLVFSLFPFYYMASAGFIATSTNYLYSVCTSVYCLCV